MIPDVKDYVVRPVGRQGRRNKFFRMLCNSCGADRGYMLKTNDKRPGCNLCAGRRGKVVDMSHKQRAYPNVDFSDWTTDKNGCRKFMTKCIECGEHKGYVREAMYLKPCRSCTNSLIKLGKPSPHRRLRGADRPVSPRQHNLKKRLSNGIRNSLKRAGSRKDGVHVFNMVDFTLEELERHLESQFVEGMSWDNMDEWHIDHIIPDSWFTYSSVDDEGFKKSWSIKNLQPVWARYNLSKQNRYKG